MTTIRTTICSRSRRSRAGAVRARAGQGARAKGAARRRAGGAPSAPPEQIDTLKPHPRHRRDPDIGVRETSVPFSFLDAQKQPQGYSVDLCLRVADAIKAELKMPRLEVRFVPVSVVQPHSGAARGQDRPRVRLDDQHARPPEAGRVRVHDVRRRHQDAGQEVVERQLASRTCAARPVVVTKGTTSEKMLKTAERRARAEARHHRIEGPRRVVQGGRRRQGGRVPDGRRAALRPHLEGEEARRLRRRRQVPVGGAVRDHDAQGRAAVRAASSTAR